MVLDSLSSLSQVLAIAKIHPFYTRDAVYPPDIETVKAVCHQAAATPINADCIRDQPLLFREDLYRIIQRLLEDHSPQNPYRRGVYVSVSGGGTSNKPLLFATNTQENRRQRAEFGRLLRATGVVKSVDCAVTVHTSGELYRYRLLHALALGQHKADVEAARGRSLDLTLELLENAGATVLAAGHRTKPEEAIRIARIYHANALSGDSSQIVQLVLYISTLKPEERADLSINKIFYTSEQLTPAQRTYIQSVLNPIEICSMLGSAEAGPYGISSPDLTEGGSASVDQDFVYDTRQTLIEILPPEAVEEDGKSKSFAPLPEGKQGVIVQTSLSRFQNPLIRYVTGDVGSVHQLPARAKGHIQEEDWPHLRVLRLRGRDPRFSFEWDGEYFDFSAITALVQDARYGVLQWQIILHKEEARMDSCVQVRVLIAEGEDSAMREDDVEQNIRHLLHVCDGNRERFSIVFVDNLEGFVRSGTGRKVVKFVDKFTKKSS